MKNLKQYVVISPAVLGGVVLCFFMNFFTIQCNNQKLASVSGYNLVMGKEFKIDNSMAMGGKNSQNAKKMPPNMWALAALVLAVAGIIVYFINPAKKFLITAVLSFAAFISLLVLKSSTLHQVIKQQSEGDKSVMGKVAEAISIVPEMGYYLALIGLAAVGIFNFLLLKESVPKAQAPAA